MKEGVRKQHAEHVRLPRAFHHRHGEAVARGVPRRPVGDRPEHIEQRPEDRQLRDQRETAAQRVDAVLLVELHRLFVEPLLVVLVPLADLLQLRHVRLHLQHGVPLLDEQRHHDESHQHHEDDDRQEPGHTA